MGILTQDEMVDKKPMTMEERIEKLEERLDNMTTVVYLHQKALAEVKSIAKIIGDHDAKSGRLNKA